MRITIKAKMTDGECHWTEDFETEFGYLPEQKDIEKYVQGVIDVFNDSRRGTESPRKCTEIVSWEQVKESSEIQIGKRTLADVEEMRRTLTDMEDYGNEKATGAKLILRWLVEGEDVLDEFEE